MQLLAAAAVTAIVNVTLIPMDRERIVPAQTVIVRDDRIVAIGDAATTPVPPDAVVIKGEDRFLLPGLTDAHVHISEGMPWAPTRPDFGDAPLYLAHGVTTVFNLAGSERDLEWRRRVATGEIAGPTIYSSGPFINEPRFRSPDEVAAEVERQKRAGFDLIKYHELDGTTRGLSRPAYLRMIDAARANGIPLVGHAPNRLGLATLLEAQQALAHSGQLSSIYFRPFLANMPWLMATGAALFLVVINALVPGAGRDARWLAGFAVVAAAGYVLADPGFFFESYIPRGVLTIAAVATSLSMMRMAHGVRWRDRVAAIAGLVLTAAFVMFWVPVSWRSSPLGIRLVATELRDAGVRVQTTLVVFDLMSPADRGRLIDDAAVDWLSPATRDLWRRMPRSGPPGGRYPEFMRAVVGELHRAGVPLVAGTDAMGIELIAPGVSLHRELQLLVTSGLTRFDAIRAATVAPAALIAKQTEFGTVAPGRRADLILVDTNPLYDLGALKRPAGVMARGRWYPREELDRMLAALR